MKRRIDSILLALALVALAASSVSAQASAAEMSAFPMPPPIGYVATKSFAYVGDSGYYTAPIYPAYSTSTGASEYSYVRYSNLNGKVIYLYGAWGPTSIAPPTATGDNCGHAHASYGVWARYELSIGFLRLSRWIRVGGGGMSGVREGGRCVFKTDGPLAAVDPRFGWGSSFFRLD